MDSSVSPKDEIWFLRVCHHISNAAYHRYVRLCIRQSVPLPLNGFFVKCDAGNAHEFLLRKFKFWLKSGKNMGHLLWRPKNVLFFPDTLNRHRRRVLCRVKRYQAVMTGEEEQTLHELDSVLRYTYIVCFLTIQYCSFIILQIARQWSGIIYTSNWWEMQIFRSPCRRKIVGLLWALHDNGVSLIPQWMRYP